ncbi:allophanate hydrolase [Sodalis sp. RH22]|uniref:allophanate hydrolase n=1 Tax=unclassified Sodalis (in: enterobacteria) TaxID=2636512 RepID=UPI0039B43FD4
MRHITCATVQEWQTHYQSKPETVRDTLTSLLARLGGPDTAWIYLATPEQLALQCDQLAKRVASIKGNRSALPLYGIPFAVKDNIDVGGWPTSAACPEFIYEASRDAQVVARLRAAGAIVIGKTNLDQFATGLVGTRSPYGAVTNSFNPDYVSGGSSSGSASVVARGLVPFALGTDTAGSGRVPAGFNNIVGLKPTKGWLSTHGVVPACRLNDCVSVFALTAADAWTIAEIAGGYSVNDAYSRHHPGTTPALMPAAPRLAVPDKVEFFGDRASEQAFRQALQKLQDSGAILEVIDYTPFSSLAEQLYEAAWVAERTVIIGSRLQDDPASLDPVVRSIIAKGLDYSACDAWRAEYLRAELSRSINETLRLFDALLVPTSPTIRTIDEMKQEPVHYNSQFGIYTNFTNLADLCALALPSSLRDDGLPAGITLIAPAWHDRALADFGMRWQQGLNLPLGATGRAIPAQRPVLREPSLLHVRVAVVGAHLRGMPLNEQLTSRGAVFVETGSTAPQYRLYALAATLPPKPGLTKAENGRSIEIELWDIPLARFGEFVDKIPAPLGIGTLILADGRAVKGFICENYALADALDITAFGGWKNYLASLA